MSDRFSQCTETCTTDCGHCKGRPVEALRTELARLTTELEVQRDEVAALRRDRQWEMDRANEAARLSAAARDDADHLRREIAQMQDHVAGVEEDRTNQDAWAVRVAMKHHQEYATTYGIDPYDAIEQSLAQAREGLAAANPYWRLRSDRAEAELDRMRAVLGEVRALHKPTLTTVEWWHDQTGDGHGLTCPTCRPEEPHTWSLPAGAAGVKPEGWVESYILSPCPTLAAIDASRSATPDAEPAPGGTEGQVWRAPFTPAQVEALNERQFGGAVHPYTCGNDSSHPPLLAISSGWSCLGCDYSQTWAHPAPGVPVDTEATP